MNQVYIIQGVKAIVVDGRIYVEATPMIEAVSEVVADVKRGYKKRGRKPKKEGKRKERALLEQDDKD